jgi:TonB family protein
VEAPPPVVESEPQPSHAINLFDSRALSAALPSAASPAMRDPGGVTRRAGDGQGPPGERDRAADREEAATRVHGFFAEATGDERLKSGRVPPRWREAERRLATGFAPEIDDVNDDNVGKQFLKQWLSHATSGPARSSEDDLARSGAGTPRGLDPSTESGGFLGWGAGGATPASAAPSYRLRTEVEVVVGADGRVISSRLVARSGRRKFDQSALEAVRQAVENGGALDEGAAVVTRWAVEAWVKVAPPAPVAGFSFDETTGKVNGSYPLKKQVQTKIALLSVTPQR